MNPLIVNDNSKILKSCFSEISDLTKLVVDVSLNELENSGVFVLPKRLKDSNDLEDKQYIIKSSDGDYYTSNVMGFIGYNNEQLIIKSRFSQNQGYFFYYILSKITKIPNIIDLISSFNANNQILNYLIFIFPMYLKQALRKGPFKKYETFNYNDYNFKGKFEISKHLTTNTPFIGKIAYSRREFSYDNHLMELIHHTIEFIKRTEHGKDILASLKNEINIINELTPSFTLADRYNIIEKNIKFKIRHSYYTEYSALQRLCLMILLYQKHDIGFGNNIIYGILIDGAWLWEEYINTLITKFFYHPMNKEKKYGQKLFDKSSKYIYPDFISRNLNNVVIADAKYKPYTNINRDDIYQILAYMFRFDAMTGIFIYPETSIQISPETLRLNQGFVLADTNNVKPREQVKVVKFGLNIPTETHSFSDFCKLMKTSEDKLIDELKSFL